MRPTGLIDWAHIDRPGFDRVVEAVLQRFHESDPELTVEVYDGRGGDQGRDAVVSRGDQVEIIYQLKHFPGGFSGGWAKARRPQVKSSFSKAMDHAPNEWVLVIPTNPTTGEAKYVRALKGKKRIRVRIVGQAELDSMLAGMPDLLDAFTRDPLVAVLKELGQEHAALTKPEDLAGVLSDLTRRVQGRSAYWGTAYSVDRKGRTVEELYAKHPHAMDYEPIAMSFVTSHEHLDDATRKRLSSLLEYGSGTSVTIPSEAVRSFVITGPEWIARDEQGGEIELHRKSGDGKPHHVELRVLTENGGTAASLRGSLVRPGEGTKGVSFDATFPGGITFRFSLPRDAQESGSVALQSSFIGEDAVDIARCIRFFDVLDESNVMEIWIDRRRATRIRTSGTIMRDEVTEETRLLIDDLTFLSNEFNLPLPVPDSLTVHERMEIRSCRLLMEGRCVMLQEASALTLTLNGSRGEGIDVLQSDAPGALVLTTGLLYEVLGHRLEVPDVKIFHPNVVVEDRSTVIAAISNGTAAGLAVRAIGADGTPFRAFIPDRVPDPSTKLIPSPLELSGIEEQRGVGTPPTGERA